MFVFAVDFVLFFVCFFFLLRLTSKEIKLRIASKKWLNLGSHRRLPPPTPANENNLKRFRKIRDANEKIPAANRLPASAFVVDEELRQLYRQRSDDDVALLRREMAFDSEKHTIARDKLFNRYYAELEAHRITLKV